MDWLRFYVDILDDEKVARMSDATYRIFTYLMLIARERDRNGAVDMSPKDIAWRVRRPEAQIKRAIPILIDLEILAEEDGALCFINWKKRQFKSDDVSARVKRFRDRKDAPHETLQSRPDENKTNQSTTAGSATGGTEPGKGGRGKSASGQTGPSGSAPAPTASKKSPIPETQTRPDEAGPGHPPENGNGNGIDAETKGLLARIMNGYWSRDRETALRLFFQSYGASHPQAIGHTLKSFLDKLEKGVEIKSPFKYLEKTILVERQNYTARDFYARERERKEGGAVPLREIFAGIRAYRERTGQ